MNKSILYAGICIAALASCAPQLDETDKQSSLRVPEQFASASQEQPAQNAVQPDMPWQEFFADETLQQLIGAALKQNRELKILEQRIAIAQNEVQARTGEYLPKVDVVAGYEYEKVGEFTSQGVNDEQAGVSERLRIHRIGFNASWEVDIWNRMRNAAKAAHMEFLASQEARHYAITQLVSEVAHEYYELKALDMQRTILAEYIDTLSKARQVVEWQMQAARATSLAVKRFDAEVLKNKTRQTELNQRITLTENNLNVLLGQLPETITRNNADITEMMPLPVNAGLPVALLENRPDIKQVTLELEAAKLNVQSAKARFYPSLTLDASIGYEAFNAAHFLSSPESLFYNAAAGIAAPLLNRMAIEADYRSANSKQIQAVYEYEQTFINAFTEVNNQLAVIGNTNTMYELKEQEIQTLTDSLNIADILFKAARIDYLETLLTQRDYLDARLELVEMKKNQFQAYVTLYKALGGGWREPA